MPKRLNVLIYQKVSHSVDAKVESFKSSVKCGNFNWCAHTGREQIGWQLRINELNFIDIFTKIFKFQ